MAYAFGFNGLITCKHYSCSVVWTSNCAWHQSPQRSNRLSIYLSSISRWSHSQCRCIENCSGQIRDAFDTPAINKMEWTWFVNYYTSLYTTVTDVIHPGINLRSLESKLASKASKKMSRARVSCVNMIFSSI